MPEFTGYYSDTISYEPETDECQVMLGADDICGLTENNPIHRVGSTHGHMFVPKAGVAQSAEQVPRKNEVVGSTPISSSKSLKESQRALLSRIVHHRVGMEDNIKAAASHKAIITKTETDWKEAKERHSRAVNAATEQVKYHRDLMEGYEAKLRDSILEDVVITGVPEKEEVENLTPEEQDNNIGRAE